MISSYAQTGHLNSTRLSQQTLNTEEWPVCLLYQMLTVVESMTDVTSSTSQLSKVGPTRFLILNPCSASPCADRVLRWCIDPRLSTFFGCGVKVSSVWDGYAPGPMDLMLSP